MADLRLRSSSAPGATGKRRRLRTPGWVLLWGMVLVALACAPRLNPAVEARATAAPETDQDNYRLGPEDTIDVSVWKDPELTKQIVIGPDGKMSYPLIGELQAAGKTVRQLREEISQRLEKYVTDPQVVEGMAPEDENLSRLRTFLAAYCQKPAGIDVLPDSLISRDQARAIPRETLARKYMAGPGNKAGAPPAAYMYVLSTIVRSSAIGVHTAPTPARKADARSRFMPAKPYASLLHYPAAIYIDPNILGSKRPDKVSLVSGTFLQHEAGHLLGIGRNPIHAVGGHCLDTSCLMYRQYDLGDLLLQEFAADIPGEVPQIHFCAKCEADVQAYLAQPSP